MSKLSIQYDSSRFTAAENALIARALKFAIAAHGDQKRATGDPYVIHPIAVGEIVAAWGLDSEVIVAALLHDVIEDTSVTAAEVNKEFGPKVSELVDGLTKLKLSTSPRPSPASARFEHTSENLRKLLLATTKDFRVILIKLADRLHNMRTLSALPDEKRARIAWESLEIFAPLADRLGMGRLKCELEDLGFENARPEEFANLRRQVEEITQDAAKYMTGLQRAIVRRLRAAGVKVIKIEARQKHYFSIYKKLIKTDGDIDKIYDLVAVRIIVPDVAACYQALGVIHQHYKPLIYRIKDYIAVPKPNGYQSLHTTVFGEEGRISEIQIRTQEMHEAAEFGLAAHFYYDSHKGTAEYAKRRGARALPANLRWVSELAQLHRASDSGQDFVEGARLELFADRIFVFSPKGDLYDLPEGATPLDFAFAVHSNLGLRALGGRVNGRLVPLDTLLENRDVVEIITRREPAPSRDWLNIVVTSHAKTKIRSWFRATSREGNVASGRAVLEAELQTWGIKRLEDLPKRVMSDALDGLHLRTPEDLYALIGEGGLGVMQAVRRLVPEPSKPKHALGVKRQEPTGRILVAGGEFPHSLALCCSPVYPQPLLGYVTRGKGVTVHALGCRNTPQDMERYTPCRWETDDDTEVLSVQLEITAGNRIGLFSDVTGVVAREKLNIGGSMVSDQDEATGMKVLKLTVEVPDLFVLSRLRRELGRLSGVERVRRIT
ncbi:MAG TPA: bifunctional (p)ppGpp synthetase/guanosine-3',5'-bis(diphosphate) 3'-pyrophosphohydrolase [Candidatus Saccharimonadia bacterium]|nr:bifunctional (p)ppGpp synthetase/guanosine-3',5'-bis(diphosphate) 3'-pyrophosphohydrolase [Candidatus Saccharimonadia bacterium]